MTRCSKLQKNYFSFEELPLWKRIVLFSLCFLTLVFLLLPYFTPSQAANVTVYTDGTPEFETYEKILAGTYSTTSTSPFSVFVAQQYAETISGQHYFNEMEDWLTLNFTIPGNGQNDHSPGAKIYSVYSTLASSFLNASLTVGKGLLLLYFLLALLEKATSDNFTVETGVKHLVKLVAGWMVIEMLVPSTGANGVQNDGLIVSVINIFNGIQHQAFDQTAISVHDYNTLIEIAEAGFGEALLWYTRIFAPYMFRWIIKVIMVSTAIARVFEAAILVVFSPIGVSNLFNGSANQFSSGIRYIKNVDAVSLQGVIIHASIIAINIMITDNGMNNGLTNIAILFAGCSFITKSKSIANEIINP